MFNDPDRRGPRTPQEQEWCTFAGDYRSSREPVQWNERTDFVLNCLRQLEDVGLTEKQWASAVRDYRIPEWRSYRAAMERAAQEAARRAAEEVQSRYRERIRRQRRPSHTHEVKTAPTVCGPNCSNRVNYAGCDHMSGPCSCFHPNPYDDQGDDDHGYLGWGADGPN